MGGSLIEVLLMIASVAHRPSSSLDQVHADFLKIMPKIVTHARICSDERCPHKRADFIAECVAVAWCWFVKAVQHGKDPLTFPTALATYAVKHIKSGRRLTGTIKPKDVMSSRAQRAHGFRVEPLPSTRCNHGHLYGAGNVQRLQDCYEERLRDNTVTPPDEQAAFRIDWPHWLTTRTERDRRIIEDMACNERTVALSRKHGISPGRVSQLRREYMEDWERFTSDTAMTAVGA